MVNSYSVKTMKDSLQVSDRNLIENMVIFQYTYRINICDRNIVLISLAQFTRGSNLTLSRMAFPQYIHLNFNT